MTGIAGDQRPGTASEEVLSAAQLRALIDAGRLLVADLDLDLVLDRLLETAQRITGARYAALGVLDAERRELARFVTRGMTAEVETRIGELPRGRGVLGILVTHPIPLRLANIADHQGGFGFPDGHPPMTSFLGVPIFTQGEAWGNLYLTEKAGGIDFDESDEESAVTLARWAGIAVAHAERVEADRLRTTIAAAETERRRWARELHDETLQRLGALRVMLAGASRAKDADSMRKALETAGEHVTDDIEALRSIITELRPSTLDALGLLPALATLAQRTKAVAGLEVTTELDLDDQAGGRRLDPDLETAVYRVVQESLTNVVRHAAAQHVRLRVFSSGRELHIQVTDDGEGFATDARPAGFGIVGMRERVELAGGSLTISASIDGTTVDARIPVVWADEPANGAPTG